jgi:hypothetical protein
MSKKRRRAWNSAAVQPEAVTLATVPAGQPPAKQDLNKVPKLRNKQAGAGLRSIPQTVPFIQPPATRNGQPVTGEQDWGNFSTRKQANSILDKIRTVMTNMSGVVIIDLKVVDTTAIDGYVLDVPLDPAKPTLADVADFSIQGHVMWFGSPVLFIDEWAGLLYSRIYEPDPESGDTNYQEIGTGDDTVDVPIPGVLAAELLISESLVEFHWAKV